MNGGAVSYEAQVEEACATIRKAVEQINEGFAMDGQNLSPQTFNQLSRWVCNISHSSSATAVLSAVAAKFERSMDTLRLCLLNVNGLVANLTVV